MSKEELLNAYEERKIGRRDFIRGLTALGISAGVAASYALAVQPVAASKGRGPGHDYGLGIGKPDGVPPGGGKPDGVPPGGGKPDGVPPGGGKPGGVPPGGQPNKRGKT